MSKILFNNEDFFMDDDEIREVKRQLKKEMEEFLANGGSYDELREDEDFKIWNNIIPVGREVGSDKYNQEEKSYEK